MPGLRFSRPRIRVVHRRQRSRRHRRRCRYSARHPAARGDPRRRRHRLRGRRRDRRPRAHRPRRPRDAARGRADARPLPGVQGARLAVRLRPPGRRARRAALLRRGQAVRLLLDHQRRLGARRRAVHGRRRHGRLLVVPLPHRRRPDQPLRADDVPLLGLRLPAAGPGRAGVELADHVRGRRAVLRQGRGVHRRHREPGGPAQRAGRRVPRPPAAQGARAAHPAGQPPARHPVHPQPAGGHHPPPERPPRLPLLRAVRPRLPHGVELLGQPGADPARARHRPAHPDRPGDGARGHDRRRGARDRRRLRRQADGGGAFDPLPRPRPGRQRLRVGPPAPQLAHERLSRPASPTTPAWSGAT